MISPSSLSTRCLSSACMAFAHRPGLAAPDNTDQLCAIASIRQSCEVFDPRGVPSSKYPRRYHSPSQAWASRLLCRRRACERHIAATLSSSLCSASAANRCKMSYRKKPSQTLSPLPSIPTRFIPSFQSPAPISGRPCSPKRSP